MKIVVIGGIAAQASSTAITERVIEIAEKALQEQRDEVPPQGITPLMRKLHTIEWVGTSTAIKRLAEAALYLERRIR